MELITKETSEANRGYAIDIDSQDFIEWLDGEDPSEDLLLEYIDYLNELYEEWN